MDVVEDDEKDSLSIDRRKIEGKSVLKEFVNLFLAPSANVPLC